MVRSPVSTTPLLRTLSTTSSSDVSDVPMTRSASDLPRAAGTALRSRPRPRSRLTIAPAAGGADEVVGRPGTGRREREPGCPKRTRLTAQGSPEGGGPSDRHEEGGIHEQPGAWS